MGYMKYLHADRKNCGECRIIKKCGMDDTAAKRSLMMLKRLIVLMLVLLALPAAALAEVVINEVMASNGIYEDGKSYDWVELRNDGKKAVDLSGWHLSDGKKNLEKFTFPKGTKLKAGACLIVYCTGEDDVEAGKGSEFYAAFSLSASGETLYLSDADLTLVQKLEFPQQYVNISYGRPAGGDSYGYFAEGTPGKANGKTVRSGVTEPPTGLTPGGFYPDGLTVTVTAPRGTTLRYTTDGETPTAKSPAFPADGLRITKTTALRVCAFREDEIPSAALSATYLVEAEQLTPVVCLVTDDKVKLFCIPFFNFFEFFLIFFVFGKKAVFLDFPLLFHIYNKGKAGLTCRQPRLAFAFFTRAFS